MIYLFLERSSFFELDKYSPGGGLNDRLIYCFFFLRAMVNDQILSSIIML